MAAIRTSSKACTEQAQYLSNEFGINIMFYPRGTYDATKNVYICNDGIVKKFKTNTEAMSYMIGISTRLEDEEQADTTEQTTEVKEVERKKTFAETIIDSMVDANGHCGERGLSRKQFNVLSRGLAETEWEYVTSWRGSYGRRDFYSKDYEGNVGRYHVVLNWYAHFNNRYTVKSIDLRDESEYEAELEAEAELKAMRDFSKSEWVAEPKKRIDLELTLVNVYEYEGEAYSYYGSHTHYIYTFRDEDGNCLVWKTQKEIDWYDEGRDEYVDAEVGSVINMKATVKEHSEYKGTKQTVITRPKVLAIA